MSRNFEFDQSIENAVAIELNEVRQSKLYYIVKRIIDIIGSLCGIIILLPIFIITSIAIRIESKGPIVFKQLRCGKNSKTFYIYKFRSMKSDTPNLSTEEFKESKLFITKVGKFIRKTSIDELPQLINILKGDMSIVGPRPLIESEEYVLKLRKEYDVDTILPGITGWAQVNGRDYISLEEKVRYDYEYLLNRSIFLDIKIIFMTVLKVLKSEGVK